MPNPDPRDVIRVLQSVPDDVLLHDADTTTMFRTLKNLWCRRSYHNYTLLNHLVQRLADGELDELVTVVNVQSPPPWIFDNSRLFHEHRSKVPVMMVTIATLDVTQPIPSLTDVIDTLGMYCVVDTYKVMERIAVTVFGHADVVTEPEKTLTTLRDQLHDAQLFNLPPLRDDVCYRFTKLCMVLLQKVRANVRVPGRN
ncbi:hypothetical protein CaLGV070 [Clostera anastomosis granulovirus A]|uniref:Uncharacterized protein n=1 Tax=Clostera anastomosis granulovirus A TaxID=1986289 RepID=U5KBL9_9BBAC|nr:hypothetical protein CaLGV070 [Clostera anastomosis granulovirus Henan]AGQ20328.1 hypothetical protein CaLGV070 [Clostera anastomosis granulovirus Henan]